MLKNRRVENNVLVVCSFFSIFVRYIYIYGVYIAIYCFG